MSSESTASHVSARILDLNSVAVVHQGELEGSGDAGKYDGDSDARDDSRLIDREEDKNVSEVKEKGGSGEGVHVVAKFAGFSHESWKKGEEVPNPTATTVDSNNDLKLKADSPKVDDADKSGAKNLSVDINPVSKELFSNDNDSIEGFKEDDSTGEVEEASKSEPAEGVLDVELGKFVDNEQLQIEEEQGSKSAFSVCDMVWGKVRSHPWWPGQIYDPSVASDMALKHQKKDHFLVAYFGDKTFAWNDKSRLKPFEYFFSQMEKQSSLGDFVDAVDEALGEVARRIEIGMTCGCIADELIADLKNQMVENAGIKEGTCRPALDQSVVVSSFDPSRLLDYIHGLAQFPCGNFVKMELVKVNAQLKAIYMSKGYSKLPEFCIGEGLSHNEEVSAYEREEAGQDDVEYKKAGIPFSDTSSKEKKRGRGRPPGKKKAIEEDGRRMEYKKDETLSIETSSMEKRRDRGRLPGKKKAIDEDGRSMEYKKDEILSNDTLPKEKKRGRGRPPGKKKDIEEDGRKQRSLPELMEQTADSASFHGRSEKDRVKASSNSSSMKRMISDTGSAHFGKGKKKSLSALGDLGSMSDSSSGARVLKIGQRLSQVAIEMQFSRSEHNDIKLHKSKSKTNGRTSSIHGNSKSPRRDAALDYPAPNEMLSQLCFAAKSPTKAHRIQSIVSSFFVNWRDSQASDSLDDDKLLNLAESNRKKSSDSDLVSVEVKSDYLQDSYWSDVMFEESPKKESPSWGRKRKSNSKINHMKRRKVAELSSLSSTLELNLNAEHVSDGSTILSEKLQEERLVNSSDNQTVEECNPAALILCFSDPDGLPSETDLIMFFSQYGPLKEAETEVSRKSKRASVMFKRGADAEVAFSSTGKFSAFGPKLVSYKLRYSKSSFPGTTPKKDPSPTEQGTSVVPDDAN